MSPLLAWTVVLVGFALPLLHVAVSSESGPWRARPEAGCPFGPRTGWVVIVLFLGPIGWALYMATRRRRAVSSASRPNGDS